MKIRPYDDIKDFEKLKKWVNNKRVHALWCANKLSYPLTRERLADTLKEQAENWNAYAYTAIDNMGKQIGFFVYAENYMDNSGYLRYIIMDPNERGKGYGTEMIQLILKYAFEISEVLKVNLNVFDVNEGGIRCYQKAGFEIKTVTKEVFPFEDENWGRCFMEAKKKLVQYRSLGR
jgi:RimJ/RimL family protein N-acetyltransferase